MHQDLPCDGLHAACQLGAQPVDSTVPVLPAPVAAGTRGPYLIDRAFATNAATLAASTISSV